jgi:hypothetical protein
MAKRASFQVPNLPRHRPVARDVGKLIASYYKKPGNGAGGSCHIVLDDGNIGTDSIAFCLEQCDFRKDAEGRAIMLAFLQMTKTQRRVALYAAHYEGE